MTPPLWKFSENSSNLVQIVFPKWCHVVAKFNPSYGVNFWVRCASVNVFLHRQTGYSVSFFLSFQQFNSPTTHRIMQGCKKHQEEPNMYMLCLFSILKVLSSPRAESARAVTGRRCPYSGVGEDFLGHRPGPLTKTGVTQERKVVD